MSKTTSFPSTWTTFSTTGSGTISTTTGTSTPLFGGWTYWPMTGYESMSVEGRTALRLGLADLIAKWALDGYPMVGYALAPAHTSFKYLGSSLVATTTTTATMTIKFKASTIKEEDDPDTS